MISTPPTSNPIWENLSGTIKAIKNIKKHHFKNLIFFFTKDRDYWMFHWAYVAEDINYQFALFAATFFHSVLLTISRW